MQYSWTYLFLLSVCCFSLHAENEEKTSPNKNSENLQGSKDDLSKLYQEVDNLSAQIRLYIKSQASNETAAPQVQPSAVSVSQPVNQQVSAEQPKAISSPIAANQAAPSLQKAKPQEAKERIFKYRPGLKQHDFYAYGEFLYWKANEQGLDYALRNVPQLPPTCSTCLFTGTTSQIGTVTLGEYDWQPGLRVGVGAVITPDFWDLEAQYTYVAPEGTDSVNSNPPSSHIMGTFAEFTNAEIDHAKARASLQFHLADLFLAKRFLISKQILLRLSGGATGAWIHQRFTVDYIAPSPEYHDQNFMAWKFHGGGVKMGLDVDWFMGKGIGLLGKIKGALLYGNYENTYTNFVYDQPSGHHIYTEQDNKLHDHRLVPTTQFAFGPTWSWKFNCCALNLYALYELNLWFNLQEFLVSNTESGQASGRGSRYTHDVLGMQGLTAGIQFNF